MYANPATFIQEAKELLDYDPSTGIFLWKVDRRYAVKAGDVAGCVQPSGYRYIQINRRAFRAPRLAWLFVHGVWPTHQIDHINGQKDDNRIANLRDVTAQQNSCNTVYRRAKTSAFTGVSKRRNGKWVAHLISALNKQQPSAFLRELVMDALLRVHVADSGNDATNLRALQA